MKGCKDIWNTNTIFFLQESLLFKDITQSVFGDSADPSFSSYVSSQEEIVLLEAIKKTLKEHNLAIHKPFEDKILQLYQVSQLNQGLHLNELFYELVFSISTFLSLTLSSYKFKT